MSDLEKQQKHHAPISVVIPCFRCADTVGRALNSVLAQTRRVAEIITVDDGSDDDTLPALHDFRADNESARVRVLSLDTNQGPGEARNAGWEVATQPWIAFLDADDSWHPRKIELQYGWLEKQPGVDLCAHESAVWARRPDDTVSDIGTPFKITPRRLLVKNVIPTRSVMLRRDLPFRFGGKDVSEDYLLWLDLGFSGYTMWKLPRVLAYAFRPEFSPGGYSGRLWTHEKRELGCLKRLYERRVLRRSLYLGATVFSLVKYFRRRLAIRLWNVGNH